MSTHSMRRNRAALGLAALGAWFAALPAHVSAQEPAAIEAPLGIPVHETLEDPFNRAFWIDEIEGLDAKDTTDLRWDATVWAGRSLQRFTLRTEGERSHGETEHAELQALWTRAFARWWDFNVGARADFAPGSEKNWAAFGVTGLAPYRFEIEATAFVSNGGDTAARLEAEYELLITNRLILQPQIELNWYGQSDIGRGQSAGLSNGEAALRLRYEFRREVAPYVGIVRERLWGDRADAARVAGLDTDDTSFVAGIRLRF